MAPDNGPPYSRAARFMTDETLAAMERELAALYSEIGRPSIAPQMLLRAMLLQALRSGYVRR